MSLFAELTNSVNAVRPGRTKMRNYDLPLLVASFTLVAIGLLMVYSASIALADGPRYANYGRYYFVVRHGLFVAVGLLISSLVLTVPFAARVHHIPYDFHRFTRYRLAQMFSAFGAVTIEERGNDLAVIANKIIVATIRQLKVLRLPLLLIGVPASLMSLAIAHVALWFGWGSKLDPLGYGLSARKD